MSARRSTVSQVRAVAFDGYGTLLRFHDDEFRAAVTEILAAQQLEHPDHEAVYGTLMRSFFKAGPWADHVDGEGRADYQHLNGRPAPTVDLDMGDMAAGSGRSPSMPTTWAATPITPPATSAPGWPPPTPTRTRTTRSSGSRVGGLRLGLLSNADEDFLQSAVSRAGLRFSVIQSSESLRAYKPNRAAFDALCHRLGCEPSAVLYVGDSIPTDVQGAHHAGLRTAWIQRSDRELPEDLPAPDLRLTALSDLPALLEAP